MEEGDSNLHPRLQGSRESSVHGTLRLSQLAESDRRKWVNSSNYKLRSQFPTFPLVQGDPHATIGEVL